MRGWEVKLDAYCRMTYVELVDDDKLQPIPSWPTYLKYWKQNYPLLRVQSKASDICGECWQIANSFRTRHSRMEKLKRQMDEEDSSDESSDSDGEDDSIADQPDLLLMLHQQMEENDLEMAKEIEAAAQHVKMYKAQRELVQKLVADSKVDLNAGKPRAEQ
eukprot:11020203-Ditylum_brightwellii.AAC.1